jgi:DNA helicase HerA-like ATPase
MLGKLRDNEITKISSKYRHYNASFIVVSQSFKAISPIIRTCASHWILFKTENQKEKAKIVEEFNGFKDFEMYLDKFTKEKYNFMYIDINKHTMHHNFTQEVAEE